MRAARPLFVDYENLRSELSSAPESTELALAQVLAPAVRNGFFLAVPYFVGLLAERAEPERPGWAQGLEALHLRDLDRFGYNTTERWFGGGGYPREEWVPLERRPASEHAYDALAPVHEAARAGGLGAISFVMAAEDGLWPFELVDPGIWW
jgi:hypothetical protein